MNYREKKNIEYLIDKGFHNQSLAEATKEILRHALYMKIDRLVEEVMKDIRLETKLSKGWQGDGYTLTMKVILE